MPINSHKPSASTLILIFAAGSLLPLASGMDPSQPPKGDEPKKQKGPVPKLRETTEDEHPRFEVGSGLPAWLTHNRVHLHWEGPLLYVEEDGTPDARFNAWLKNVQGRIKNMGPGVTIGLAKKGAEGAWWPSRVGASLPEAQTRNVFKEFFLDPMQDSGIRFIAYYRHDIDKPMEALHPEWLSLGENGKPIANLDCDPTAHRLCLNSPYREFVKTRLVELAEQGTSGVYFDQDHMNEVCTCGNCKEQFLAARGYPMAENLKPYTPEFLDVAKFIGASISETFAEWRAAVRKVKPDMIFIAGADELVDFVGIHHDESLPDSIDLLKSEFQKCFGGQQHFPAAPLRTMFKANPAYYAPLRAQQESLLWTIARDAGAGRPAHVWNYKPHKNFGETFHTNMALVAHGAISSTTVDVVANDHSYKDLFALGRLLGNQFADAVPYGWAALHVSTAIKERAYPADGEATRSYKQTFEQLYAPVLAASDALQKEHIPFVTMSDKDVREARISPLTRVLIVPSADLLPHRLQESLANLELDGVNVIRLSSKDPWYLASSVPTLQEMLLKDLVTQSGRPPIQVEGPPKVRVNYFLNRNGKGILVTAIQDWNYFWFFGNDQNSRRSSLPEPELASGMKLVLRDPSMEAANAQIIDFQESPTAEIVRDGTVVNLPPLSIYQFLQVSLKD